MSHKTRSPSTDELLQYARRLLPPELSNFLHYRMSAQRSSTSPDTSALLQQARNLLPPEIARSLHHQPSIAPYRALFVLFHPFLLCQHAWSWYSAATLHQRAIALVITLTLLFAWPLIALASLGLYLLGFGPFHPQPQTTPLILTPGPGVEPTADSLITLVRGSVQSLKKLADSSGALLFRGWHLDTIEDYERVLDALGLTPTSFFGQAPRKPAGRLLARNVAFEAAKSGSLYEALKTRVGVVWSWAPMFLNFHNEMAYLDPEHHLAEYGVFCCHEASEVGGYTPIADARRVLARPWMCVQQVKQP